MLPWLWGWSSSQTRVLSACALSLGRQKALVEADLARAKEAIFDVLTAARQMTAIYHFLR